MKRIYVTLTILLFLLSCSDEKYGEKGFSLQETTENETNSGINEGVPSKKIITKASNVLLTGSSDYRLITIYKVNYDPKKEKSFTGSNKIIRNYWSEEKEESGNNWHYHFMPGLEALYGYNMLNIAHYSIKSGKQKNLFKSPVLVKTLYYPSYIQDTLNFQPVNRNYYLVSVYDEDTNRDSLINGNDLRRFYHFDLEGNNQTLLIPKNYSVVKSEYDPANDQMYVFAQLDQNANGKREEEEEIHIFWIDLKNPINTGRLF